MPNKFKVISIFVSVILACLFIFLIWQSTPSYTVFKVASSVASRDQVDFLARVDVDRVAEGAVEDFSAILMNNLGLQANDSSLGGLLAAQLLTGFKESGAKIVKENIEKYFSGRPIEAEDSSVGAFSSAIAYFLLQPDNLKISWRWRTEKESDFAMVTVPIEDLKTGKSFLLRFKLEKHADRWRVVRIYNLIESYFQLGH